MTAKTVVAAAAVQAIDVTSAEVRFSTARMSKPRVFIEIGMDVTFREGAEFGVLPSLLLHGSVLDGRRLGRAAPLRQPPRRSVVRGDRVRARVYPKSRWLCVLTVRGP
jgi:hypothetical protein